MGYLIGTDEAGYGPNLGPLVVSASVWEVPPETRADDLYRRLRKVIATTPGEARTEDSDRVAMADSKALYQPGGGLHHLERGVLAALALLDRRPTCWREAFDLIAPESDADRQAIPWYAAYDAPLPIDTDPADLGLLGSTLKTELAAAGVRLLELRSRVIFPERFNRLVDQHDSKSAVLSHVTLGLAAELAAPLDDRSISILCDKHGGRNRYRDLLAEHFDDAFIEIRGESRNRSVYRFGPPDRRVEIRFQAKGESYLPTALASMTSKYLRELAMQALNDFWCGRVPNLRPTAGYPKDAVRFKAAIAAVQAELGIDDRTLWRTR